MKLVTVTKINIQHTFHCHFHEETQINKSLAEKSQRELFKSYAEQKRSIFYNNTADTITKRLSMLPLH